MDPNQQQPPRGDYQSVSAERPRTYVDPSGSVPPAVEVTEISAVPVQSPEVPVSEPSNDVPSPEPMPASEIPALAVPRPAVSAPVINDITRPEPLLAAPAPEPLLEAHIAARAEAAAIPAPYATDTPVERPWQTPILAQQKPAAWKTQKFWLITSSTLIGLLLIVGALSWYKGTHHTPDYKIPVTAVTEVDTNNDVKTIGNTEAEKSANAKRQQTILKLRTALETYYTAKLHYPTTADMGNIAWVTANLKDVTTGDLKDPTGTIATLANAPAKNQYSYQAGPDAHLGVCDNAAQNCNYYTLTATLSDGSHYTKSALH